MRIFLDGSPTYNKVMEAYRMLRLKGIKVGLMMVVSKVNVKEPDEIWRWVLEEKIQNFDFLPCFEPERYRDGKTVYTVSEDEMVFFATRLFDLWFDHADPLIKIRTFKEAVKGQLGGKVGVCSWKGNCSTYASIDPKGNIFLCGRYHCFPETCLGNIMKNSLGEILEGQKTKFIDQKIIEGQQKCVSCRWYSMCFSGCPFLKYAVSGVWDSHYIHCQYRKKLFEHIKGRISA